MATAFPIIADRQFNHAYETYAFAAALRRSKADELEADAVEDAIDRALDDLMHTPAGGVADIATKAAIIMAEFSEGDAIPARFVATLLADLRGAVQ